MHQGQTYVVAHFDEEDSHAAVVAGDPGWSTHARSVAGFDIGRIEQSQGWGPVELWFGSVDVRHPVPAFLRILPGGGVRAAPPRALPDRAAPHQAGGRAQPAARCRPPPARADRHSSTPCPAGGNRRACTNGRLAVWPVVARALVAAWGAPADRPVVRPIRRASCAQRRSAHSALLWAKGSRRDFSRGSACGRCRRDHGGAARAGDLPSSRQNLPCAAHLPRQRSGSAAL